MSILITPTFYGNTNKWGLLATSTPGAPLAVLAWFKTRVAAEQYAASVGLHTFAIARLERLAGAAV